VRVSFRTRDLVVVSWPIAREDAERLLPRSLEPSEVDGRYLISVVAMRHEGKLRYGQINIRTYVDHAGEQAVYFLVTRVTVPGLVGVLMGAPFAPSRISVARGSVDAPGLGVTFRYEVGEETDPGPVGTHELGIYGKSRLKAFRIRRGPAVWRRATLDEPVRVDPLVVYGLEPEARGADAFYADAARLELESRPERLRLPVQRGKIEVP
jgi:hypothetical protein